MDRETVNTIRLLAADMVQTAASGHPGMAMGAAPMAYAAFREMKAWGARPDWADRDRFVLSAGHGSAMLYAVLHLFGYDLSMEELKAFRQFGSKTCGHPEYGVAPGVDVSTGPLGQGVANAVGMAIAERALAAKFNRPDYEVVNHYTYALCGDGCLMQGISNEAASLAGHLGLGKLILLYDSNDISIEGGTGIAFTENTGARFSALGWHVQRVDNGNEDLDAIAAAIAKAKAVTDKPSMIEVKTTIGYGAPTRAGTSKAHGEPLGDGELAKAKEFFGFDPAADFQVPAAVGAHMQGLIAANAKKAAAWDALFSDYEKAHPDLAQKWADTHPWKPLDFANDKDFWAIGRDKELEEPRTLSHQLLNHLADRVDNLIGGSCDLGPSNKSTMTGRDYFSKEVPGGTNIHFGSREFGMTAIANGIAAHGGLRPYVADFLVFSDYMKGALRMAALMKLPLISILTHDSIGVGEDGPTHQPVEQLASLRSIPGMTVIRPAGGAEIAAAWQLALSRPGPTALVMARQKTRILPTDGADALKGGYIAMDTPGPPDIILIATGTEVALALDAADVLGQSHKIQARVVSLPSFEVFDEQSAAYREQILPKSVTKRLAVEASSPFGWHKYVGTDGHVIAVPTFGESGKPAALFSHFGFTVENVVAKVLEAWY